MKTVVSTQAKTNTNLLWRWGRRLFRFFLRRKRRRISLYYC